MSEPFAVRVAGPSGATWYLDALGDRNTYEKRRRFITYQAAESFMDQAWAILSRVKTGDTVEKHYRDLGFTVDVVNVEGP